MASVLALAETPKYTHPFPLAPTWKASGKDPIGLSCVNFLGQFLIHLWVLVFSDLKWMGGTKRSLKIHWLLMS